MAPESIDLQYEIKKRVSLQTLFIQDEASFSPYRPFPRFHRMSKTA